MKKILIHLVLIMFLVSSSIVYVNAQDTLSKKDKAKKEQVKKDNKKPQKKEATKKSSKKKSSKKSSKGKAVAKGHDKKAAPQSKKQEKSDADSVK